jgi:hypothetical protein
MRTRIQLARAQGIVFVTCRKQPRELNSQAKAGSAPRIMQTEHKK